MLTERQYKSLCQYRDSIVPVPGKVDDLAEYFFEQKLIQVEKTEYSVQDGCEIFYVKASWALTTKGKLALEEYEEQARKERAEQEENKKMMKSKHIASIFEALAIAVVAAIIAGIFLYYWPNIVEIIGSLSLPR